jgi:hypothetical protein
METFLVEQGLKIDRKILIKEVLLKTSLRGPMSSNVFLVMK